MSIQYTWSQKFSSIPWVEFVYINLLHWITWSTSCYVLHTARRLKFISVGSYSHMLPCSEAWLASIFTHHALISIVLHSAVLMYSVSIVCMIMLVTSTSGNDTHFWLLLLWIILAHYVGQVQCYIMCMNYIYLFAHFACKLTYSRCDMHILCMHVLLYNYTTL